MSNFEGIREKDYMKKRINLRKNSILALFVFSLISIVIQSAQIYTRGYILGVDSIFHMNRVYETMMQLKTHNFEYFISLFSFQQSARIINAMYGPLMSYVLGGILLFTGSWVKFQLITSFLLNVIAALGVFRISRKMHVSTTSSIICGCIYMTTYLVSSWNYMGAFTGVGAMLVPWVIYYGIEMCINSDRSFSVIGLGLSMGILIQTHNFSAVLATLTLFPFVIYSLFTSCNKLKFLRNLFFSVGISVMSSLNVWLGMLLVFRGDTLLGTAPMNLFDRATHFNALSNNGLGNLGIILTIIFWTQLIYIIINWNNIETIQKIVGFTGGLFLIVSSTLFPWNFFSELFPNLETTLQIPARLLIIPSILLCVSIAKSIEDCDQKFFKAILAAITIFMISNAQGRINDQMSVWESDNVLASPNIKPKGITPDEMRAIIKNEDIGKVLKVVQKGTSDYLPVKEKVSNEEYIEMNPYGLYSKLIISENNQFEKSVKNGVLYVKWNSDNDELMPVPIFRYSNTNLRLNGLNISPDSTEIGSVVVKAQEGLNTLAVYYKTPLYINCSVLLSCSVILILIIFCIFYSDVSNYLWRKNI